MRNSDFVQSSIAWTENWGKVHVITVFQKQPPKLFIRCCVGKDLHISDFSPHSYSVNVGHSLAEQVLQRGVFLASGLRVFTAHYHICLWNNTEGEVQNTLVNWHMHACFAQSKISLCNVVLLAPVITIQLCKVTERTISLRYKRLHLLWPENFN